jgi:hypothetical protein
LANSGLKRRDCLGDGAGRDFGAESGAPERAFFGDEVKKPNLLDLLDVDLHEGNSMD